jgi:hypothetical protein
MAKKPPYETLTFFEKEDADMFMEAVQITSKETLISNSSIFRRTDMTVDVFDTHSVFLVNIGRNYEKLIKKEEREKYTTSVLPVLASAMFDEYTPSNPLPFLSGLMDGVKLNGTDYIRSDEAKKIMFTILQQMYGTCFLLESFTEFQRLLNLKEDGKN